MWMPVEKHGGNLVGEGGGRRRGFLSPFFIPVAGLAGLAGLLQNVLCIESYQSARQFVDSHNVTSSLPSVPKSDGSDPSTRPPVRHDLP